MRRPLARVGVKAGTLAPLLACWLPCLLLAAPLWAGQVHVVEGDGAERVVVDTSDAGVDEVLAVLAAHFGFTVERSAPSGQTVRFSGRLQGALDEVLERLLRHEGHMIVRSRAASAGIERLLLLDLKGGAPAPTVAGPIAAIKSKLREREEVGR
jgi:hypothetical protein